MKVVVVYCVNHHRILPNPSGSDLIRWRENQGSSGGGGVVVVGINASGHHASVIWYLHSLSRSHSFTHNVVIDMVPD
jgi:hypothetical protein